MSTEKTDLRVIKTKLDLVQQLTRESMDRLNVCINLKYDSLKVDDKEIFKIILEETFKIIESDIVFYKIMLTKTIHKNFNFLLN